MLQKARLLDFKKGRDWEKETERKRKQNKREK